MDGAGKAHGGESPEPGAAEPGWTLTSSFPQPELFLSFCHTLLGPLAVTLGLSGASRSSGTNESYFCLRLEVWSSLTGREGSIPYCGWQFNAIKGWDGSVNGRQPVFTRRMWLVKCSVCRPCEDIMGLSVLRGT